MFNYFISCKEYEYFGKLKSFLEIKRKKLKLTTYGIIKINEIMKWNQKEKYQP